MGRGGRFPVGSHPVSYALQDANANVYAKECKFTVEVLPPGTRHRRLWWRVGGKVGTQYVVRSSSHKANA